jgi:tellurite resistance protein TerC
MDQPWLWLAFNAGVVTLLVVDLCVFHRQAHEVRRREAVVWSVVWIGLALAFAAALYVIRGRAPALEFLAGYVIEKSLSIDNIFVFVLIFSFFQVPARYQHRVLFWGVLGALVMRGAMIAAGAYLVAHFHWVFYVFGTFLVVTGIRLATQREHSLNPAANPVIRLLRRMVPVTSDDHGQAFFVREPAGSSTRLVATPLFVVLALVETTDLIFAVDSIPAVFAVTRDTFIVYSSNVFAVLGLRALYFVIAGILREICFLQLGLAVILVLVGVKMLVADLYEVPIGASLGAIVAIIAGAALASWLWPGAAKDDMAHGATGAPKTPTVVP